MRAYRRPGLTPQQQRQWRVNVHRRRGQLQEWAAAVLARLGPRVEELNDRELDLLANTLAGAQSAFNREGRGTPVSVPQMLRRIGTRLRLPAF